MIQRRWLIATAAATLVGGAGVLIALQIPKSGRAPRQLLLAPMIGVFDSCISIEKLGRPGTDESLRQRCTDLESGSAAALVEATLKLLGARRSSGRYELGYTLQVPLLQLFERANGGWVVEDRVLDRIARTIRDTDRSAVVYLFSTHFGVSAPLEIELATDPANLSETVEGPIPTGTYYGTPVYRWSIARQDNPITSRRLQATRAVVERLCRLPPADRAKVKAFTLLGELHHFFPDFERDMGFSDRYVVSDHSAASQAGFRMFLKDRYGSIDRFNAAMGTRWTDFSQVDPPSKDIRSQPLKDFTNHIDSYAAGRIPLSGWLFSPLSREIPTVVVYLNGKQIGEARASLGRQDVRDAKPEFGFADTGWRYDLDFRSIAVGRHRIDLYVRGEHNRLQRLATRHIAIMDRLQSPPPELSFEEPPASDPLDQRIQFHIDTPADQTAYFFNPLTVVWHEFRQQQVLRYLEPFRQVVDESCFAGAELAYSHQIIPFSNPGWDESKFAIDASIAKRPGITLGASLYGEASYGSSFLSWLRTAEHEHYGVTEFHPLRPLTPTELKRALDDHASRGARFVSFFLEPRWNGEVVDREHNIFSFDPKNSRFASDRLYESMRGLMTAVP